MTHQALIISSVCGVYWVIDCYLSDLLLHFLPVAVYVIKAVPEIVLKCILLNVRIRARNRCFSACYIQLTMGGVCVDIQL